MKKLLSLAMAALLVLSICSYALAASEGTPYYYTLSGGVNGKRNTAKVEKESTGAAENVVDYLSRTLADDEPVIMKVRYGANGNPVTDGRDIFVEDTYYIHPRQGCGAERRQGHCSLANDNSPGASPYAPLRGRN